MDKEEFTQSSIHSIAWVKLINSTMVDLDFINIHIQINTNLQTSMDTNIQKSNQVKHYLQHLLYQLDLLLLQMRMRMGVRSTTRCCMDVLVPSTGTG